METKTKLTLKEIIARKEQIINERKSKKTADLYIKSLDGTITIQQLERSVIAEASEMQDTKGDVFAVYQAVIEPPLKSQELRDAFGCVEPIEIVEKLFAPGEISGIAKEVLNLSGYTDDSVSVVDGLKN